jgi:glycosyltransferase involved in cell wall biosynthesis
MFAYNEARHIEKSVRSVLSNVDKRLKSFIVIANGCTDATVDILRNIKQQLEFTKLEIVDIEIGDKCNAWNEYVHHLHTDSAVHFFTDADVEFTYMAFPKMFDTLLEQTSAQAIAGMPFSGRNKRFYRELIINRSCLFGNCYGVKLDFLKLACQRKFKLPKGLSWIDSAITKAINGDLLYQNKNFPNRVTYNETSGYKFRSLNPLRIHDVKLYLSRIARYNVGKLQEKYLEQLNYQQWPDDLNEINQHILAQIVKGRIKVPIYLRKRIINRLQKKL